MHFALFRIQLKSRHELLRYLSSALLRLLPPERDTLWIEIPIERHASMGDKTINSEILIAQKREMKQITLSMPHIDKILNPTDPSSHLWNKKEQSLLVMGENQESVEAFFKDPRIVETIINNSDMIYAIHITD